MTIEWDKLEENPGKKYKFRGVQILLLKDEMEKLEKVISDSTSTRDELTAKIASLEKDITNLESELQNQIMENDSIIIRIKEDMVDKASRDENELKSLGRQLKELLGELDAKEDIIREKDEAINELNNKNEELNTKIDELKEQIPKKPVYEKAEEVIKGAGCPKCGWTTFEEYKFVDGQRKLIRKYCPNTFCSWTSTGEPKVAIATREIPEEVIKEVRIFRVRGAETLEEITTLDSTMVAIIADPAQEVVWIWKGKDSNRFDYAEATRHAITIKNEMVKSYAPTKRINEGEEPSNFPKL